MMIVEVKVEYDTRGKYRGAKKRSEPTFRVANTPLDMP